MMSARRGRSGGEALADAGEHADLGQHQQARERQGDTAAMYLRHSYNSVAKANDMLGTLPTSRVAAMTGELRAAKLNRGKARSQRSGSGVLRVSAARTAIRAAGEACRAPLAYRDRDSVSRS
jgi:hypothetical protein